MKVTTLEQCYREWLAANGPYSQITPHTSQIEVWKWLIREFGHCRTRKAVRQKMDDLHSGAIASCDK